MLLVGVILWLSGVVVVVQRAHVSSGCGMTSMQVGGWQGFGGVRQAGRQAGSRGAERGSGERVRGEGECGRGGGVGAWSNVGWVSRVECRRRYGRRLAGLRVGRWGESWAFPASFLVLQRVVTTTVLLLRGKYRMQSDDTEYTSIQIRQGGTHCCL